MIDDMNEKELLKKIHSQAEDVYKITKVLDKYCSAHDDKEDVSALIPLTHMLCKQSDNMFCNLCMLLDEEDMDDD